MKQFLEKLKDARTVQRNYPCIFDDSNVRSLFGMLDVTGKGFITYEQYKQGDVSYMYYMQFYKFEKQTFTSNIPVILVIISVSYVSPNMLPSACCAHAMQHKTLELWVKINVHVI